MSELSEVISEMRNMRESYDQISTAAEAYNTGKAQLAQNITSKGVPASASETIPELAEKVSAIAQESYTIQGGEMYAKQLFGSLETPNYWNLYDILAQLLSDGRLVNYGGILLAEYYRGYDSLALSGAGAGGAYVVSDLDENGQFKMYTDDTTHTWDTEFDGKGNRWVAYCFAEEYHDFQITDTNTSPRSIFIGRKVGTITSLVNGRVSQIVVPDGNSLLSFNTGTYSQNWGQRVVVRNIENLQGAIMFVPSSTTIKTESVYLHSKKISNNGKLVYGATHSVLDVASIIAHIEEAEGTPALFGNGVNLGTLKTLQICGLKSGRINVYYDNNGANNLETLSILDCENCVISNNFGANVYPNTCRVYVDKSSNDKAKGLSFGIWNNSGYNKWGNIQDLIIEGGWCRPLDVQYLTGLTETNIYAHILQRLKQDEPDCGDGVTITLGSTNLAKLTSQESIDLLDLLTNTYGYTFA